MYIIVFYEHYITTNTNYLCCDGVLQPSSLWFGPHWRASNKDHLIRICIKGRARWF